MKKLINRISGYGIILLLAFLVIQSPSMHLIIATFGLISLFLLTSNYARNVFVFLFFILPLLLGMFFKLNQINQYPSVAAFYAAFTWTALFVIILLFLDRNKIDKNAGPNDHNKNQ